MCTEARICATPASHSPRWMKRFQRRQPVSPINSAFLSFFTTDNATHGSRSACNFFLQRDKQPLWFIIYSIHSVAEVACFYFYTVYREVAKGKTIEDRSMKYRMILFSWDDYESNYSRMRRIVRVGIGWFIAKFFKIFVDLYDDSNDENRIIRGRDE